MFPFSVAIAAEIGDKSAGSAVSSDGGAGLADSEVAAVTGATCSGCMSGVADDLIAVSRAIARETAIKSAESAPGDVIADGGFCVADGRSAAGGTALSAEAAALARQVEQGPVMALPGWLVAPGGRRQGFVRS